MKKKLIIIRTNGRDDFIAWLCYQTFRKVCKDADYIFFAEYEDWEFTKQKYEWINTTCQPIFYHEFCSNFGGRDYLVPYFWYLKAMLMQLDLSSYDYVGISDADMIFLKNPFDEDFDIGGIQDANNWRHISGQFMVFKPDVLKRILRSNIFREIDEVMERGYAVADDTVFTHIATKEEIKIRDFYEKDYWIHHKGYDLKPWWTEPENFHITLSPENIKTSVNFLINI